MRTIKTVVEQGAIRWPLGLRYPLATTLAVAAIALFLPALASADNRSKEPGAPAAQADATEAPEAADPNFEAKFLQLLSDGKQSEAEELVIRQLVCYPKMVKLIELVSRGKEKQAHDYKMQNLAELRTAQRPLFLMACCQRSRFNEKGAFLLFNMVWMLDHRTPAAKCAYFVLGLDSQQLRQASKKEIDRAFKIMRKMADENPDDVMVRWMLAVQCRSWERNEEGAEAYKQVLEKWNPGPALVHQTYANLLDELRRYDEALVERQQVVKMEPAGWSYDGLGNTLHNLGRNDEACAVHRMATSIAPDRSMYWSNWAVALNGQRDYAEAIEKCQRALQLDDQNWRAYFMWGKALAGQGNPELALEKCKLATDKVDNCAELNALLADLKARLEE